MLVYISWSNYTLTTIRSFSQVYVLIYVATIRSFAGAYTHFKNLRIVALRRCIVATYSDAKNAYMCKSGSVYVAYSKIRSPDVYEITKSRDLSSTNHFIQPVLFWILGHLGTGRPLCSVTEIWKSRKVTVKFIHFRRGFLIFPIISRLLNSYMKG